MQRRLVMGGASQQEVAEGCLWASPAGLLAPGQVQQAQKAAQLGVWGGAHSSPRPVRLGLPGRLSHRTTDRQSPTGVARRAAIPQLNKAVGAPEILRREQGRPALETSLAAGFPPRAARVEPGEPHFRSPHPFILGKAKAPTRSCLQREGWPVPGDSCWRRFVHGDRRMTLPFIHSRADALTHPSGPPCCVPGAGQGAVGPPCASAPRPTSPRPREAASSRCPAGTDGWRFAARSSQEGVGDNTDNVRPGLTGFVHQLIHPCGLGASQWPLTL